MQFLNVKRHGQKDDCNERIFHPFSEDSAEVHVDLDVRERTFGLDAPVDPQIDAFF